MTTAAGFLVATGGGLRPMTVAAGVTGETSTTAGQVPLDHQRWKAIVIHHSGTPSGSPESLERTHQSWGYASLGYHFVIGNGIDFGDGAVARGPRWLRQEPGAHVRDRERGAEPDARWFNEHAIGICLIGNGERRSFSEAQLRSLIDLVTELQREFGIPDNQVFLHSDLANVASPGRFFPVAVFESSLSH
ncbi:MAG: peptidoglycan recognition family protein [Phycisphaerales bacterium]